MKLLRSLMSLLACSALVSVAEAADPAIVRLGFSGPMSDPAWDGLGGKVRDGAQFAVEELNAQDLRIGDTAVRLELVVVDDHSDPSMAETVVRTMVDAHVAGVVGPLSSGISLHAAPLFAQAGLPTITPSATHPALTRMGLANTFRLQPDDAALASRLVAWAAREQHLKHVALVTESSGYGKAMAGLFKLAAHAAGSIEVDEIALDPNTASVAAVVGELRAERPDAVLVAGGEASGVALAREMRARGAWFTLIGPDGLCALNFAQLTGALKPGQVLCARQGHAPSGASAAAAFDRHFTQRFGHAPDADDAGAAYAYEAVRVFVAAMQDARSSEPAVYMSHIRTTRLPDSFVGDIRFDERGDVPDGAISLFTYDGLDRVYRAPLP